MFSTIDDELEFLKIRTAINRREKYPLLAERLRTYYQERKKEYYESLRNGSFNILDELRKNELYDKIRLYNSIVAREKRATRLNPEEWFEKVDMYCTFQDYNQRVLTRH